MTLHIVADNSESQEQPVTTEEDLVIYCMLAAYSLNRNLFAERRLLKDFPNWASDRPDPEPPHNGGSQAGYVNRIQEAA